LDPKNPPLWRLKTSSYRLPVSDPLSSFKTNNKLLQVLARAEADAADADEALMLNTNGEVAECSGANLFWIYRETVYTTPTGRGRCKQRPSAPGVFLHGPGEDWRRHWHFFFFAAHLSFWAPGHCRFCLAERGHDGSRGPQPTG